MKKLLFLLFLLSMPFAHGMKKVPNSPPWPSDIEVRYHAALPNCISKLHQGASIFQLFTPSVNDVLSLAVRLPLEKSSSQDPISSLPLLRWISHKDLHIALSEAAFAIIVGTTGFRTGKNEKPNEIMCQKFMAGFIRSLITTKLSGYINQQLASFMKKAQENRKIDPAALVAPLTEYHVRVMYDFLLIRALDIYHFRKHISHNSL